MKHYLYAKLGHNSIRDNKVIHVFVFFKLLRWFRSLMHLSMLIQSFSLLCEAKSYWLLTCTAICTSLTSPTNGFISYGPDTSAPFDLGTTATYGCNPGYGLSGGSATRTCTGANSWSGSAPVCLGTIIWCSCRPNTFPQIIVIIITCLFLDPIPNGEITYSPNISPFDVGTTATYSCNTGFYLDGNSARTCSGSGTWDGSTPRCLGMPM